MRAFGMVQTADSKPTSSQVAWISSLLRTSVSRIMRSASRVVGYVATVSMHRCICRISVGESALSFGTKVAMDAAPTSSAGLGTFSPCRFAKA